MSSRVVSSFAVSGADTTAPAARADSAVADYSRDVTGKLAVMDSHAERFDADLAGHRPGEFATADQAA